MMDVLTSPASCLHNASMTNILIRNVPSDVHERLSARARESGMSLQQYVLDVLQSRVSRPTTRETIERWRLVAEERENRPQVDVMDSVEAVRIAREETIEHLLEVRDENMRH